MFSIICHLAQINFFFAKQTRVYLLSFVLSCHSIYFVFVFLDLSKKVRGLGDVCYEPEKIM